VNKCFELINEQSNTNDGNNTFIEEPDGRPTNKYTNQPKEQFQEIISIIRESRTSKSRSTYKNI